MYEKHKTIENQIQLKKPRAQARRKCKFSKRNSWIEYTSALKHNTPSATVWKKINTIQGSLTSLVINALLKEDSTLITDPIEMANEVAYSFAKNASDTKYNLKFREFKNRYSIQGMNSNLEDNSPINHCITSEIKATLQQCKNTSSGPDKIANILLKNLTNNSVAYLQKI